MMSVEANASLYAGTVADEKLNLPIMVPGQVPAGSNFVDSDSRSFAIDGPGDDVYHGYKMVFSRFGGSVLPSTTASRARTGWTRRSSTTRARRTRDRRPRLPPLLRRRPPAAWWAGRPTRPRYWVNEHADPELAHRPDAGHRADRCRGHRVAGSGADRSRSHNVPGVSEELPIGVVGVGWVGLVTAACFAELGHDVVAMDVDEAKVEALRGGEVPIHEPGLAELVARRPRAAALHHRHGRGARARPAAVLLRRHPADATPATPTSRACRPSSRACAATASTPSS